MVHKLIKTTARDTAYPDTQVVSVVGLLLLASQEFGQDFSVPSTWRVESFSSDVDRICVYAIRTETRNDTFEGRHRRYGRLCR